MTLDELRVIVGRIQFRDWEIRTMEKGDGFLLQVRFMVPDSRTHDVCLQSCRKWYISAHASKNEVVRTAWKAVLAAVEHEAGEDFRYNGVSIYSPHMDSEWASEVKAPQALRRPHNPREQVLGIGGVSTLDADIWKGLEDGLVDAISLPDPEPVFIYCPDCETSVEVPPGFQEAPVEDLMSMLHATCSTLNPLREDAGAVIDRILR